MRKVYAFILIILISSIVLPPTLSAQSIMSVSATDTAFNPGRSGSTNSLEGSASAADTAFNPAAIAFATDTQPSFLKNTLDQVVVTALGIRREEKSLGYAAQSVKGNAVKDAKTNNWVNSLNGKVPGLNIQSAGAGPMGSSRITLRGESSLNLDNNQALIVVDGVPVSSKISGTGFTSHLSQDSPVDFGSDISDLNPDDIEKITVLKGPGATALYGSRAAGGALIITTKSGSRKGKGLGITYNVNGSMDRVNRWPDYQFEYGEGRTDKYFSYLDSEDGPNTATGVAAGRAWGPRSTVSYITSSTPTPPLGSRRSALPGWQTKTMSPIFSEQASACRTALP